MYTINKIECSFPDGFKPVVTTNQVISELPQKEVERNETQTKFKTVDKPDLLARTLLIYSKVRNKYEVVIYIEAGINLTLLQTAEYLKVTFQDGTVLPYVDVNSLQFEKIGIGTQWKATFQFTELYDNTENEISYLTFPEIGRNVNKLRYYISDSYTDFYAYTESPYTYFEIENIGDFANITAGDTIDIIVDSVGYSATCVLLEAGLLTFQIVGEITIVEFQLVKYLYTKIQHTAELIEGEIEKYNVQEINNLLQAYDYDTIQCRFYLNLAQKNDFLKYCKLQPIGNVVFIDYLGNEYASIELIEPKFSDVEGVYQLYIYDMVLKYKQYLNGTEL